MVSKISIVVLVSVLVACCQCHSSESHSREEYNHSPSFPVETSSHSILQHSLHELHDAVWKQKLAVQSMHDYYSDYMTNPMTYASVYNTRKSALDMSEKHLNDAYYQYQLNFKNYASQVEL